MVTSRIVRNQFTDWSMSQSMAYASGARAAIRGASAVISATEYIEEDPFGDDCTQHFYYGYADAIGTSAEGESWFEEISDWRIEYQWWEK